PERFAEHYHQAALFYNSQTPVEQAHIVGGFAVELGQVTVPAIRERTVAMLRNVSDDLARRVAEGLGMATLPSPLPLALENPPEPEIMQSPPLSLMARPGDGGIATRTIAILVADGVDESAVWTLTETLIAQGAVVRLVGPRIGVLQGSGGGALDADASLENHPGVLFDAVAVPDGQQAAHALAADPKAREFLQDQFLHCKTILASRDAERLLRKAGITQEEESASGVIVCERVD